jgi:hypothetical protein
MTDPGSTAPRHQTRERSEAKEAAAGRYPPDPASCAAELLSIVAYLTARDGPLQASPAAAVTASPWHGRLLRKAGERLDVVDAYMRARVAFLVAGRDRGYYAPAAELELAGATLDAARATTAVVADLLASRCPSRHDFEAMSAAVLRINPALDAQRDASPDPQES